MAKVTLREVLGAATAHFQAGRMREAESLFRQVVAAQPMEPNSLHFLGLIALQTGRAEEAVKLLTQVVEKYPEFIEARSNLGAALQQAKRLTEAAECFEKLLREKPEFAKGHFNLGRVYKEQGWLEEAVGAYVRAIASDPGFAEPRSNLAAIYRDVERLAEAEACMREAVALKPGSADFWYFLAVTQKDQRKFAEAIGAFERAITIDGKHAEAHRDLGYLLLMRGDFERGLAEHEWRWWCKDVQNPYPHPVQPAWDGKPLNGRSIFLVTEQGMGDSIQYVRYAAMIAAGGGRVHLVCPEPLRRLFMGVAGVEKCYVARDAMPLTDVYATTLTLPYLFGTRMESIPRAVPYLAAGAGEVAKWREKLAGYAGKLKVGLVWAGNPKHTNDRQRSIALEKLAPLGELTDMVFFSLQKRAAGAGAGGEPPFELVDFTEELNDFVDTAGLIENLDLVISVDTSVAHLAGAMGKPVWVLLPEVADWRWFLERSDSPWYPTMRLFRQTRRGEWASVIAEVVAALTTTTATT